jgi:PAS domain-containing protein
MRVLFEPSDGRGPEERYIDFVYQPIVEPDGSVTGIFVHGIDITDNKREAGGSRAKVAAMEELVFREPAE